MQIHIHHYHHYDNDVKQLLEKVMSQLDDLKAQVAANRTIAQSAVTLINGIADRIAAAGTDAQALADLTNSLKQDDDALAAAVAANTPAAGSGSTGATGATGA